MPGKRQDNWSTLLPTDGEAPIDPEQERKVAEVEIVVVGTAAADTGTPSDKCAGRSGSRVVKLFIVSIRSGPLVGSVDCFAGGRCLRLPRFVRWDHC